MKRTQRMEPAAPARDTLARAAGSCLVLALAAVAGCGLDEYEKRMELAAARLKKYDKENGLLGAPLNQPQETATKPDDLKKQEELRQLGVFLRPPKQIRPEPFQSDPFQLNKEGFTEPVKFGGTVLHRYPGTTAGHNLFLAIDRGVLKDPEPFQREVVGALQVYSHHLFKRVPPIPQPLGKYLVVSLKQYPKTQTEDFAPVRVAGLHVSEAKELHEPSQYALYFHQADGYQVAVIYQAPLATANEAGIDWSLKTLGLGKAYQLQKASWENSVRHALYERSLRK
ncbi:MAG: hypothetical protein L0Z62_35100 [Gemmataceae bacterium]|nr:hypothetical protein [Gemmataceae bacterium]